MASHTRRFGTAKTKFLSSAAPHPITSAYVKMDIYDGIYDGITDGKWTLMMGGGGVKNIWGHNTHLESPLLLIDAGQKAEGEGGGLSCAGLGLRNQVVVPGGSQIGKFWKQRANILADNTRRLITNNKTKSLRQPPPPRTVCGRSWAE